MRSLATHATLLVVLGIATVAAGTRPRIGAWHVQWEYPTRGRLPQATQPDNLGRPYLYVALKTGGVGVLDVRGRAPARVATVAARQLGRLDAMNLAQHGTTLFVALGDFFSARGSKTGLAALDVSDPARPRVRSSWISARVLQGSAAVVSDGRYAYLGAMGEGIVVLDVGDPDHVRRVATLALDPDFPRPHPSRTQRPNARGLALHGDRLVVADDAGGVRLVDVSEPARPREEARYVNTALGRKQQAYNDIAIDWPRLYTAVDYCGMEVLEVTPGGRIRQLGWWNPWTCQASSNVWLNSPGHTNQVAFDPAAREVYLSAGDSELQVVDVSDPAAPRLVRAYRHAQGWPGDLGRGPRTRCGLPHRHHGVRAVSRDVGWCGRARPRGRGGLACT